MRLRQRYPPPTTAYQPRGHPPSVPSGSGLTCTRAPARKYPMREPRMSICSKMGTQIQSAVISGPEGSVVASATLADASLAPAAAATTTAASAWADGRCAARGTACEPLMYRWRGSRSTGEASVSSGCERAHRSSMCVQLETARSASAVHPNRPTTDDICLNCLMGLRPRACGRRVVL